MWIVLFFISCTSLLVNGYGYEEIVGEGRWSVLNSLQCDDPEQYAIQYLITQRKLNRTHDAFTIHADMDRELNFSYGLEVLADKEVDGGFKFYHQLVDDSFCKILKKHTGDNFPKILAQANVDPPDCPIPEGDFTIKDYVIDYVQLAKTGMFGTFDVTAYITYMGERVACTRWLVQFEKIKEDDDYDYC